MRIALVHSRYRSDQPSGENVVVDAQAAALSARGHDVVCIERSSDDLQAGAAVQARTAVEVATGRGFDPREELTAFRPDVVHVHNLFPNFGTRWLSRWPGPLVATLHNYRALCANGLLLREGRECTLCPDGEPWSGVRHGCYRGSRLASLPLAIRNRRGLAADPVVQRCDRVIALSRRAGQILARYGVPGHKLALIPNGIADSIDARRTDGNGRWAFVGRISAEKGLLDLMAIWPAGEPLDVIGSGPQDHDVRRAAPASVRFLGAMHNESLREALPEYSGLILPGINPEGAYPLTAVEALAAGIPLVARTQGAGADMVDRWACGSVFGGSADLPAALGAARSPALRMQARNTFLAHFTMDTWLDAAEGLYADVRDRRR